MIGLSLGIYVVAEQSMSSPRLSNVWQYYMYVSPGSINILLCMMLDSSIEYRVVQSFHQAFHQH